MMLAFVLHRRKEFNDFQEVFFFATTGFETGAEMFYILAGLAVPLRRERFRRALATNPVHHFGRALLLGGDEERNTQYFRIANVAVFIALLSFLPWALIVPMFGGPSLKVESDNLTTALSAWSFVGVALLVLSVVFNIQLYEFQPNHVMFHSIVSMTMYVLMKCFELHVLLSDYERLCPGLLGKTLVLLQLSEIVSVGPMVVALILGLRRQSQEVVWHRPSPFFDVPQFPDPSLFMSIESISSAPA